MARSGRSPDRTRTTEAHLDHHTRTVRRHRRLQGDTRRPPATRGTARRFDNTPEGIAALVAWVAPLAPTLVVLEATGGYERAAVAALSLKGLPVCLVNPKRVRDFAGALGRLAKTDAIDAGVLAEFADKVRPPCGPWPTPRRRNSRRCWPVGAS